MRAEPIHKTLWNLISVLITIVLVLAFFLMHSSGPVEAFFPTNLHTVLGIEGRSHTSITRQAIEEIDSEFFGITTLTKSMKKAREEIADANAEVDKDQHTASKH